ncbi:MAG TPA: tetratricopeptide repeat protein [Gemmatimonadaceae bacterium]|nr:tetratricopeptide repeat protein [Gemmatimonadaceae bacterium]
MNPELHEDPAQLPLGGLVPPVNDPVAQALERGESALAHGKIDEAVAAFRDALQTSPGHVRARVRLAVSLDRKGDPEGAIAELDRALAQQQDNVTLLLGRAAVTSGRQRYTQAEADLRRALKLSESNAQVHLQLGVLQCRRARWREAIGFLRRAVELDPSLVPPHYYLGEAYNHVDQLDAARHSYERAAELEPANWRALQGLGVVYDRLGRPVEAAAAYRRSREAQRT